MDRTLIIRGLSTISPLGTSTVEVMRLLDDPRPGAIPCALRNDRPIFPLTSSGEALLERIAQEERFKRLDRVSHLALASVRQTLDRACGRHGDIGCVSIGSSRGATHTLEQTIAEFGGGAGKVPTETSPTTTAGNISSWAAQEILARRSSSSSGAPLASLSTSMTCSSAFQSLITACACIRAGFTRAAVFGGSEACLTPYTIAHLEALRIYADGDTPWPCRPCGSVSVATNTVALGEGAGTALLLEDDNAEVEGDLELLGIGWAVEETPTATGLSSDGRAFECSMRMACEKLSPERRVDTIIAHAPGSVRGDEAELRAVARTFGEGVMVCSTKHLTGHTYGASGMVSLGMAQALLEGGAWRGFPYPAAVGGYLVAHPRTVLINTAGFGGNSVSVVVGLRKRG